MDDDDFQRLLGLLRRYCDEELDQWDMWRLESEFGDVYMYLGRNPTHGASPDDFVHMPPRE